jgi:hypothetical protein
MRRILISGILAAVLGLCATAWAQEVVFRGYVQKVDPLNATITLRTTGNPRIVPVAPSAVVMLRGKAVTLEQIPLNSEVSITAVKDAQNVARATRITIETPRDMPSAASGPGGLVRGTVVGIHLPSNSIRVRTLSGDARVDLGTAPIMVNGRETNTAAIRLGDTVEIQRVAGTDAGTELTTRLVTITGRAAGYRATTHSTGARRSSPRR